MSSKDKKEKYATEKRIQKERMDRKMKLKELELKKGTYFDTIRAQVTEINEEREFKEAMKADKTPMLSPVFNQVKGIILRQRENKPRLSTTTGHEKIDIGTPLLDIPLIEQEVQDSKAMDEMLEDNKNYLEVSRLCKEVVKLNFKRETYQPKGDATGTRVEELFKERTEDNVCGDQIQQQHIFDKKESIKQRMLNSEKILLKQAQQQAIMQQKNIIIAQKRALIHQLSVKAYNDAQAPSTPNTSQLIRSESLSPPAKKIQLLKQQQQLQQSMERKLSILIKSNNDSPRNFKDKIETQDNNNNSKGGFQEKQHLSNFSIRLETLPPAEQSGSNAHDDKNLSQGRNQEKGLFLFKEVSRDGQDDNETSQYFQGNENQHKKSNQGRAIKHATSIFPQRAHSEDEQLSSHLLFFASPVYNRVSAKKPRVLQEQYPKARQHMHTEISNFSKYSQQHNTYSPEKNNSSGYYHASNNEQSRNNILLNVSKNENNNNKSTTTTTMNLANRRIALENMQLDQEKEEERQRQLLRDSRLQRVQKKLGLIGPSSSRKEQYNKIHKELSELQSEMQEAQQQSQLNQQPRQSNRRSQKNKEISSIIIPSQVIQNGPPSINNNNNNTERDPAGIFYSSSRSSTQHQTNSSFINQLFHNKINQPQSKLSQQSSRLLQHSIHSASRQQQNNINNNNQWELYSGNKNNNNNNTKLQTEPSGKKSTHSLHVISSRDHLLNPAQTFQTLSSSISMQNQPEPEVAMMNKLHRTQTFSDSVTFKDNKTSHASNQNQNQLSNVQNQRKSGLLKLQLPVTKEQQVFFSQNIVQNEQLQKSQQSSHDINQSQLFSLIRQNNSIQQRHFDKNAQSDRLSTKQISPQNKRTSLTSSLSPDVRMSRMNSELSSFIQKKQSGQEYFANKNQNNHNNNNLEFGRKITQDDKNLEKQRIKMHSFFSHLLEYEDQAQALSHTINKKLTKDFAAIAGTLKNWNQIFSEANAGNNRLEKNSALQALLGYAGNEES